MRLEFPGGFHFKCIILKMWETIDLRTSQNEWHGIGRGLMGQTYALSRVFFSTGACKPYVLFVCDIDSE